MNTDGSTQTKKFNEFRRQELVGRIEFDHEGRKACFFWELQTTGEILVERGWWLDPETRISLDDLRRIAQEFATESGCDVLLQFPNAADEHLTP